MANMDNVNIKFTCYMCGHKNYNSKLDQDACLNCKSQLTNSERQLKKYKTWMNFAKNLSELATCDRLHVGSVVINDNRVVSTGYNGSIAGLDHCDDVGHKIVNGHCLRTVHSESNAIAAAPKKDLEGADLFCTHRPCHRCFLLVAQAGIKRIIFNEVYGNADAEYLDLAQQKGIVIAQFQPEQETKLKILT